MHCSLLGLPVLSRSFRCLCGVPEAPVNPSPEQPVPWAVDFTISEDMQGKPFREPTVNQVGLTKHWRF